MAWRMIAPEIEPDGISWAKGMGGGVPIAVKTAFNASLIILKKWDKPKFKKLLNAYKKGAKLTA